MSWRTTATVSSSSIAAAVAEGAEGKQISQAAVNKAIRLAAYLETHARRIYASGLVSEVTAAKAILFHIREGDLEDGFRARELHRKRWMNLSERGLAQAALELLCDHDWIAEEISRPGPEGGRPSTIYRINPGFGSFVSSPPRHV